MEKLLQNIVKKFIKQIDFNKIQLKKVEDGHADEIDSSQADGNDYHVYKIKYNHLTIGTVVTVTNRIENTKYLANIDINAAFRSRGIGGYVLRHWFSGYYIMADNSRAARLYARLGKIYNKFTHKEFEEFVKLAGMRGVYKLDHKGAIMRRRAIVRRGYKDFGVKGMKKGVRKAVQTVSNSAVGKIAGTIGKNYKKAATNNIGLAKKMLKSKGVWNKLTGVRMAASTPLATALGGTALNIKAGIKGAKKLITGKDSSAYKDSLVIMSYRKRQLRDAKVAYLRAKKRCLDRRDSNLRRNDSQANLIIAKRRYRDAFRCYRDSVLDTLKQKFDNVFQKIKKTIKEYIKAFPFLSSLASSLMGMSSIYDTYGVVMGAPKILSALEYQSKIIDQSDFSVYGKAGLKARNVLIALYVVARQIIKAIIKLKIAKGISQTLQEK